MMETWLASFISKGTPSGWTLCILVVVGLIILLKILAVQRPKMRELEQQAEESVQSLLVARVTRVEEDLKQERFGRGEDRRELEGKIDRQRELYESKLETERARHEAAEMLSRHKVRNLEQCLSAFLWMAEKRPDNIPEVVAEIRKMRADQEAAEAAEAGSVAGAKIVAARAKEPVG